MSAYVIDERLVRRLEELRIARVRQRAENALKIQRKKLPRITRAQAETIVKMIVDAEEHGRRAVLKEWFDQEQDDKRLRSSRGVLARREAAAKKRQTFLAAFEAAAARGGDLSVEKLAAECGISRATAHRYLKQPKQTPKSVFRPARKIAR